VQTDAGEASTSAAPVAGAWDAVTEDTLQTLEDDLGAGHVQCLAQMAHLLRASQQDCARAKEIQNMSGLCVYVLVDYMMKWLPMRHKCAHSQLVHVENGRGLDR
jgi:hypothetical protein